MKVAVAFDHRGVHLRDTVLELLRGDGHEIVDLGTDTDAVRIDYPGKAREIGEAVERGDAERGVLACGSGVGESGELARLMTDDAVVGVTTNPTIFQKAMSEGGAYDEQLKDLIAQETDPKEIFLKLSARDVEMALDLFAPVHEADPQDGFVSWEVDPTLAYDREATFDEAMRLHAWLDRPNLYVKIPATKPGLGAIEDSIAHGKSINVTLIFSLQRYKEVVEAYLLGLERLVASGGDPSKVHSGASV